MYRLENILEEFTENFKVVAKEDLEIMNSNLQNKYKIQDLDKYLQKKINSVNSLIIKSTNKKFNYKYKICKNFGKYYIISLETGEKFKMTFEIDSYIDVKFRVCMN